VALVVFTYPVIVTLLSAIFGLDVLTTRGLAAAVLAVAGCALTVGGEVGGVGIGIVYALLSALIYATYVVLSSRLAAGVPSLVTALHLAQGAGLVCVTLALARGGIGIPASFAAWGSVVGIALFSTVVALRTFLAGLSRIGPARASVLSSMEVVITMIFAFALLGERLGARQWAGAFLIMGAVALQNAGELRRLRLPARWRVSRP
jgi:drug/metabolite transporter (DMT)-like permease